MVSGKKILVTGGSRGIGRATVLALAKAGADVAFTYHSNTAAAEAVCQEAEEASARVLALQAEAEQFEKTKETVEHVRQMLGGLDGVVLNAGITRDRPLVMMPEESWDEVMTTNLKGTFNYARAAIYDMVRQRSGRIVCVSSVSGLVGVPGQTNYAATKAGQIGFVKSLSKEVAAYGVTVNAVAPGFIETDIWESIPESKREGIMNSIPQKRLGKAEEVAAAIRFLLSEEAAYITGSVLVIDGGLSS
ncbi:3-oxoacyl-ACP reductase FabG [Brevibacillus humidisoli]|uniref:3-oxoacyl-ACP reductase FabG n=1 Tax=Brevibacillus humidisoli TaxID=2895522 RepID=UPI001E2AA149|nr:3-oxoacyl-ACP reductase FabG [Brevibacillus humidisoli]UFJ42564.1 3-oxoacyl-ACP reductase FabG [Brevibacillus humidisoli]